MTAKTDFTEQEWKQLLQAPGAAGIYIMMADPNFVIGSMKEAFAVSCSIIEKGKEHNSELLASLLTEFKEREMAKKAQLKFEQKNLDGVKKTALEALKAAAALLDAKATPDEAAEIKSWLYDVSVKAANAAKEGGFLGFGGTRVSEKEKAALQEIAGILGVSS
jgi:hypothetical protein